MIDRQSLWDFYIIKPYTFLHSNPRKYSIISLSIEHKYEADLVWFLRPLWPYNQSPCLLNKFPRVKKGVGYLAVHIKIKPLIIYI